jgi:hypothetical protein
MSLSLSTSPVVAELRQVRQLSFAPQQPAWTLLDPFSRFGQQSLTLTQKGDLLSFASRRNGVWELYRIHDWATDKPVVDHLQLADYFSSKDQHDLEDLTVRVYVTPDGAHAICVGSAFWVKRVQLHSLPGRL